MNWQHIRTIISRHRLVYAVSGAIGISLLLTVISVTIYVHSGASQLDLSRPGYEKVRSNVIKPDDSVKFSSTGAIDAASITQFKALLTKQHNTLQQIDGFKTDVLSDEQLHLNAGSTTTGQ